MALVGNIGACWCAEVYTNSGDGMDKGTQARENEQSHHQPGSWASPAENQAPSQSFEQVRLMISSALWLDLFQRDNLRGRNKHWEACITPDKR